MVRHIKIANIIRTKKNQVVKINNLFIQKFTKHLNNIASLSILDECAMPTKVSTASQADARNRHREYLKRLPPEKHNKLLTGNPLFVFDPVVYKYIWCSMRPPIPYHYLQLFEHLPYVPGHPRGELVCLLSVPPTIDARTSHSVPPPHLPPAP